MLRKKASSFRLVQIRTSVVEIDDTPYPFESFRLVQICTSIVVKKALSTPEMSFRLVQIRTSIVAYTLYRYVGYWF